MIVNKVAIAEETITLLAGERISRKYRITGERPGHFTVDVNGSEAKLTVLGLGSASD